jgi:hypothetical protein
MDIYYTLQSSRGLRNRLRLHRAYYFLDTPSWQAVSMLIEREDEDFG